MPTNHGLITTPRDLHAPFQWTRETDPTGDTPNLVEAGDFWLQVSTATLKRRTDADDGWDTLIPSPAAPHTHVVADITDFAEGVDDRVAALVVAGTGISATYDDAAGSLTIANTATLDAEGVRDTMAAALAAGTNITITVDDPGDTITIAATGGGTGMTDPTTTKGDLIVHATGGTTRLAVGTDGQVLTADATAAEGLAWADAAAGGGTSEPFEFSRKIVEVSHPGGGSGLVIRNWSAPTVVASGTTDVVDDDGGWNKYDTSATSGNAATLKGGGTAASAFKMVRPVQLPDLLLRIKTDASLADVRLWAGLVANALDASSDASGIAVAAFRYDTGVDGTAFWRTVTNDGTTTGNVTTTTAGIAVSTLYLLRIKVVSTTSIEFYVNGTLVATHTTDLPGASQDLGFWLSLTTLAAAAKSIRFSRLVLSAAV